MEVMIDIETTGTRPTSQILTIGAVKFLRSGTVSSATFYVRLWDDERFTTDEGTMEWWSKLKENVRREAFNKGSGFDVCSALQKRSAWYNGATRVWVNRSNFDIIILENAYRQEEITPPWKFFEVRDLGTLLDITSMRLVERNNHTALDDAKNQAKALVQALRKYSLLCEVMLEY